MGQNLHHRITRGTRKLFRRIARYKFFVKGGGLWHSAVTSAHQHSLMLLTPGTCLGAYEIVSAIGAGGMGEVYRARDRKLDRDVAVKILPEALAADPERIARFEREPYRAQRRSRGSRQVRGAPVESTP
jgi:serine/threonine protein kinase